MAIKNMTEIPESNMELTGSEETPETTSETTPTPEEPKEEKVEADPTPETTPEEPMLYETPDGRQVTADELQKEWKDNFLPEFTRKSQALADIEREKELKSISEDEPEWKKDDYVPENYAEVIELAKTEALAEIQNSTRIEQERVAGIQKAVEIELANIKTLDPKLDENALFQHANKYGFNNLKTAYTNMSDMKKTAVDVEQRTVKNLKTREVDPISTGSGGELPDDSGYDPTEMSRFDGAAEYLSHLKSKK
tara:strand:+ start:5640 stop:6395 length:756 start_codon:yes stop_codon:yes gene_type:complete